jgi:hypothetical protein
MTLARISHTRSAAALAPPAFAALLAIACAGCQILGAVASTVPMNEKPRYNGLANQSVAVMVFVDRGVLLDYPDLPLDVANTIEDRLRVANTKETKGITFPVLARSIVRYQKDHPGLEAIDIRDVAPRFGVSRLIYIEINDFGTRGDLSADLFRGTINATLQVVEITNGKAEVKYTEDDVKCAFPEKAPPEGLPNVSDTDVYRGVIDSFGTQVAIRFITHPVEADD